MYKIKVSTSSTSASAWIAKLRSNKTQAQHLKGSALQAHQQETWQEAIWCTHLQ